MMNKYPIGTTFLVVLDSEVGFKTLKRGETLLVTGDEGTPRIGMRARIAPRDDSPFFLFTKGGRDFEIEESIFNQLLEERSVIDITSPQKVILELFDELSRFKKG